VASDAALRRVVTVQLDDWPNQMRWLRQNGYDVAGVSLALQRVDVVTSTRGLAALHARGLVVVAEKGAAPAPFASPEAPDAQYQTPASLQTKLKAYAAAHPKTTKLVSIGKSREARDIWAFEITRDATKHTPGKPAVLFNGMHHAREVMSTEVPLDTIDYLLANDGKDAKVTHWIDANEIWVIPMLNVDGSNRVWTDDAFWRKNASGCKPGVTCASGTGVDINRNYTYAWATCNGSSTDPSADDYHGPTAGSEPETRALQSLVGQIRPTFDLSYHSYSELVLYPYGCDGTYTPQRTLLASIGSKMASLLPLDEGGGTYTPGTPWEVLYAVDGDDIDWMYNTYAVLPFVVEMNSPNQGFQPGYAAWRNKTVQKMRPAWQLLLDQLDGSGVRGVLTGAAPAAGTTVEVSTIGLHITQKRAVNPDGSFHLVLSPGSYHVHVTGPGHAPFDQTVAIGATRTNLSIPW